MALFTDKKYYILDGATGTRLLKLGMTAADHTPVWALEHSAEYLSVARSYVEAGSDLLYAPTFGSTAPELKRHRYKGSLRELNIELVGLTKEAADGRPVGGDLSPTGLRFYPLGDDSFDDIIEAYAEQVTALEEAGVDFYAIETQMSLAECRAAVIAVRSLSDKPILVSFTCGNTGRTLFGESLPAAMLCLQDMGISAFGINCCGNLGLMTRMMGSLHSYARVPLVAKPNAGEPQLVRGETVYKMVPSRICASMPKWAERGVRFFGGCCGTDDHTIAAMRAAADRLEPPAPEETAEETPPLAASPFVIQKLTSHIRMETLPIDDNLVENAAVSEEMGAKLLRVHLRDEDCIDLLEEAQFSIRLPLAVSSDDPELLPLFLRVYNGKPIIL